MNYNIELKFTLRFPSNFIPATGYRRRLYEYPAISVWHICLTYLFDMSLACFTLQESAQQICALFHFLQISRPRLLRQFTSTESSFGFSVALSELPYIRYVGNSATGSDFSFYFVSPLPPPPILSLLKKKEFTPQFLSLYFCQRFKICQNVMNEPSGWRCLPISRNAFFQFKRTRKDFLVACRQHVNVMLETGCFKYNF